MEKWERSNGMSLMIMKHSIPEAIRGAIPEESRAKTFLDQIVNRFAANEKVETNSILSKLVSTFSFAANRFAIWSRNVLARVSSCIALLITSRIESFIIIRLMQLDRSHFSIAAFCSAVLALVRSAWRFS